MDKQPVEFRQQALASRQTHNRQETVVRLNPPLSWLALATLYAVLAVAAAWGFWGEIPTQVRGEGVLMVQGGTIYSAVAPDGSGRVVAVTVVPGDAVAEGQIVAELYPESLRQQAEAAQIQLEQLSSGYTALQRDAQDELAIRQVLVDQQNELLRRVIEVEQANLANLSELVEIKQAAQASGVETRERVVEAMSERYRSEVEIAHSRDRLKQNEIGQAEHRDRWKERVREFGLRVEEAERQRAELQYRLEHARFVRSPAEGVVTSVQTSIGRIAVGGTAIVTIASLGAGMDALVFMPPQDGKRIKPGMSALIAPSTIKQEEYGSIVGEVATVSQFPVSKEAMSAILQNPNLVDFFLKAGPPITVRVRLQQDPATFSGFKWTSSTGPQLIVSPGSIAAAEITVRHQSPLSLLVPSLGQVLDE